MKRWRTAWPRVSKSCTNLRRSSLQGAPRIMETRCIEWAFSPLFMTSTILPYWRNTKEWSPKQKLVVSPAFQCQINPVLVAYQADWVEIRFPLVKVRCVVGTWGHDSHLIPNLAAIIYLQLISWPPLSAKCRTVSRVDGIFWYSVSNACDPTGIAKCDKVQSLARSPSKPIDLIWNLCTVLPMDLIT